MTNETCELDRPEFKFGSYFKDGVNLQNINVCAVLWRLAFTFVEIDDFFLKIIFLF